MNPLKCPLFTIFLIFSFSRLIICVNQTLDTNTIELFNLNISTKTYLRPVRCQSFRIFSKSKPVDISIQTTAKARILITQKYLTECNSQVFQNCDKSSQVCFQASVRGDGMYSMSNCLPQIYLYVYLQTYNGGFVQVEENENLKCPSNNTVNPNPYSPACGNIPLYQCGVRSGQCEQQCYRLDCTYLDRSNRNRTYQMCLNSSIQSWDWQEHCSADNQFNNAKKKKVIGHYCTKDPVILDLTDRENEESFIWGLLQWIFYIGIIAFIASIVYYRYQINKTGIAPFNPPRWVPDIIYPRQTVQAQGDPLQNYRVI